jgi:LPS export ABC transporter protein LptC
LKKIFVIVIILIAIAAGGYYLVQRLLRDPAQLVKNLPEIAKHLEFELDNVRYGHTRLGVKKWELSTRKAKRIKGQKNILLEGVTARIYADGKLKDDTRIQADTGSYLVDHGDMELQGAVKIKNKQFNIETERLLYRADSEQIEAPEKVMVESEKLSIKANRATIDLKQQQLHFSGAVKASIRLDRKLSAGKKPAAAKMRNR